MAEFGTSSAFRGWVRVRGYGFGVRGRKVKSRDCALASDLVRANTTPRPLHYDFWDTLSPVPFYDVYKYRWCAEKQMVTKTNVGQLQGTRHAHAFHYLYQRPGSGMLLVHRRGKTLSRTYCLMPDITLLANTFSVCEKEHTFISINVL